MKIRIFTDGACSGNPGPGGWAIVINTEDNCEQRSGCELETTNNRMELTAVIEAMKYIKTLPKDAAVEIYSDSAYVVNTINNCWLQNWRMNGWKTKTGDDVKNVDLWKQFYECYKTRAINVKFYKVKGHAGNTFNELVDKLARAESLKAQSRK